MARYFNPIEDLPKIGRPLTGFRAYEMLLRQLQAGEVLVGVYDKFIFKAAPFIRDAATYAHFEQSYESGLFLSRAFYAVPQEIAEAHDRPLETSERR